MRELASMHGTVLDVGCGTAPYRELVLVAPSGATRHLGLDMTSDRYPDQELTWDGRVMPLPDAAVQQILLTEVLEHCQDPASVLGECFRVLAPGGRLLLTVPFLWPLHEVPYDEYRYTPFALERLLGSAGFSQVEVRAMGGWDASLAQMLGLWVRRRPMNRWKRAVLSRILVPVVRVLSAKDRRPELFREGTMVTGLSATAVKQP
ncbi:MAG: class I SAM-dependent methyltransferase [Mycobacteriales bacterium]|nr:class I SAM-dependent methyltransferase [Mycobacteriales bacterium]